MTAVRRIAAFCSTCATIAAAACGESSSKSSAGTATFDTLPGGIVRVTNRAMADNGLWSLVLERTVQPHDDSAGALRAPDDVLLIEDGSLLVADEKPAEVLRFNPAGQYVGSMGREGAGPGEYRSPYLAARGDTLVVQDPTQARAVMFSLATGAPIGQRPTTPRYYAKVYIDGAGHAVAPMMTSPDSITGPRQGYIRFSLNGATLDTVYVSEHPRASLRWLVREGKNIKFEMLVPYQARDVHAVDPNGGFVTGWSGEFMLRATKGGRDTVRLISRPEVIGTVSAEEKNAIVEEAIAGVKGQAPEQVLRESLLASAIPDKRPAFEQVHVDASGRIWTRRTETDTTKVSFDLFDKDGRWLDVVSVAANGWNKVWWQPVSFTRDRVAVLVEDADGRPAVLIYRITRRGT